MQTAEIFICRTTLRWRAGYARNDAAAVATMKAAANEEDELEVLPLAPRPIVPARERLGELYLIVGKPMEALSAFNAALVLAPCRRGALRGRAEAERRINHF